MAVKVLTEDMKQLTGGQVIINSDAAQSADILTGSFRRDVLP